MPALEVARGAVDLSRKSIVPLKFTAARARSARNAEYVRAASSIARVLDAGLSVAMVNLGDVSICATAYDVLDELRRRGYATQMIPGITSFCAVAAALGTSLTDRDSPLHIYPDETEKSGHGAGAFRHKGADEIRQGHRQRPPRHSRAAVLQRRPPWSPTAVCPRSASSAR